jgi:site-specific recombinase XerD
MERRGLVVADVARHPELTWQAKGPVRRDYLTLQEATALLQTKAATAAQYPEGCARWATEIRDLTFLSLALATGRRRSGLRELRLANVDTERNEIRIEREKGRTGRVLPVASWAMTMVKTYRDRARPILCWQRDNDAFFPGERTPLLGKNTIHEILHRAHAETVSAHPDLTELATKRLSPHSLRVSFAHLIFQGGANIRTINELMLHQQLGTTSRYVPVPLDDLRRACVRMIRLELLRQAEHLGEEVDRALRLLWPPDQPALLGRAEIGDVPHAREPDHAAGDNLALLNSRGGILSSFRIFFIFFCSD